MSRRVAIGQGGLWHMHLCPCGTEWCCSKPDCRNTEDCTPCEMQQVEDFFRARGDSAEQLTMEGVK